jgi:hypothetical protein
MLDEYVARELPSKVQPAEILRWNCKRVSSKTDKWGGLGFCFEGV